MNTSIEFQMDLINIDIWDDEWDVKQQVRASRFFEHEEHYVSFSTMMERDDDTFVHVRFTLSPDEAREFADELLDAADEDPDPIVES